VLVSNEILRQPPIPFGVNDWAVPLIVREHGPRVWLLPTPTQRQQPERAKGDVPEVVEGVQHEEPDDPTDHVDTAGDQRIALLERPGCIPVLNLEPKLVLWTDTSAHQAAPSSPSIRPRTQRSDLGAGAGHSRRRVVAPMLSLPRSWE
jgi:hypothetical protein